MNRSDAKRIAENISNEDIQLMLINAENEIVDWTVRALGNKSFTKGTAWNVLSCSKFDVKEKHHILYKINLIREFGEYLPDKLKPKKIKKTLPPPVHQEPIFEDRELFCPKCGESCGKGMGSGRIYMLHNTVGCEEAKRH